MSASSQSFAKDWFDLGLWRGGVSGNYKSILSLQKNRDVGVFPHESQWVSEQRLRIEAELSQDYFRLELVNDFSLFLQSANRPRIQVPDFSPKNVWNLDKRIIDEDSLILLSSLDRASVRIGTGYLNLTVGKQVVPTGVGHLFKAVSQVPRNPFLEIDPEFPVTEDAVALIWNGALAMEARLLPRVQGQKLHNFHIRAKGSKSGYDVALTAGRSDDKSFIGLEVAGNLRGSLVRGELVSYQHNNQDIFQGLLGFDTVFSRTLSGDFEIFYNGFGNSKPYLLQSPVHRPSPYLGRWYLGTRFRWEASALWKVVLFTIANVEDPSVLTQLSVNYSLTSNSDLIFGQYLNIGSSQSEFGGLLLTPAGLAGPQLGLPDITYALYRYYF